MSSPSSPSAYYPHPDSYFHPSNAQYQSGMKALLSSTWHVLEQVGQADVCHKIIEIDLVQIATTPESP